MEYNRIWAPIAVLGIIVAAAFCYSYFDKVDKANADFQNAKLITEQTREGLVTRQQMVEARSRTSTEYQAALAKLQKAEARLHTAEQQLADAGKKQRSIEADLAYLVKSLPSIVQKVRADTIDTSYAEVALESGKLLKNAKIRKVEEESISFMHAEGIGSVSLAELPKEMLIKFDLGEQSLVRRLQSLQSSLVEKPETAVRPKPMTPASDDKSPSAADAARLKQLMYKQADLESKSATAKQNLRGWQTQVQSLASQIESNKTRGVPTTKLREQYQQAAAQQAAAQQNVNLLDEDLRKLKVEIDAMNNRTR